MPTNYVDMSADEIEYIAGESQASIKGKALKAFRQRGGPKTTEESRKKAMDVTVAMIGFAVSIPFGTIGLITSGLGYLYSITSWEDLSWIRQRPVEPHIWLWIVSFWL